MRTNLGQGKLPPQATDLEEKVIGAIMIAPGILDEVSGILKPEMFYREHHTKIYEAILRLSEASKPIDISTVMVELKKAGELDMIGGVFHLTALTDAITGYGSEAFYATVIAEKHLKRSTIESAHKTIEACYSDKDDIFDIISDSDGHKDAMLDSLSQKAEVDSETLFDQAIHEMKNKVEGMTGVPSGIQGIDAVLGGFQPGSLIIIAARPAMGKTSCVLSIALNASLLGKKIGFFSLEMSNIQLMNRLLSNTAEVEQWKIQKGDKFLLPHEKTAINSAKDKIKDIYWDDTPSITIQEFRAKARRMKRKYGIEMIVVDYLQLMSGGRNFKGNTEAEVSIISRGLKLVAKELDIAVVALSQLSRAVESRPGNSKRPMLSDLRSSGSIEQDADVVAFIYRPEVYNIMEDENGESTVGMAEFIIRKNRHGDIGDVKLRFVGKYSRFTDSVDSLVDAGRSDAGMQSNFGFDNTPDWAKDDDPF